MESHDINLDIDNRIIYIHKNDEDNCISYFSSASFIKNLDILDKTKKPITVKLISCDGGDLSDAFAIYAAMRLSRNTITIHGYGFICSAGTIIMQGAKYRYLSKESEFMVHRGVVAVEHMLNAKSTVESNRRLNSRMLDIYANRCVDGQFFKDRSYSVGRTKTYIDTKMKNDGDIWMSPEQALEFGFIDGII